MAPHLSVFLAPAALPPTHSLHCIASTGCALAAMQAFCTESGLGNSPTIFHLQGPPGTEFQGLQGYLNFLGQGTMHARQKRQFACPSPSDLWVCRRETCLLRKELSQFKYIHARESCLCKYVRHHDIFIAAKLQNTYKQQLPKLDK